MKTAEMLEVAMFLISINSDEIIKTGHPFGRYAESSSSLKTCSA
jgi:hypothetical protein